VVNDAMNFLHVVSALGLTAAFGVEAAGRVGLRRATSAAQALLWRRTRRWVLLIGPGSIGLVLATGIYLTVAEWGTGAWIVVSLVSLVALASIGGVLIGVPMVRITPAIERAPGLLPEELRHDLRSPLLTVSIMTRIAITVGIVFLMVQKPALLPPSSRSSWPPESASPRALSPARARPRRARSTQPPRQRTASDENIRFSPVGLDYSIWLCCVGRSQRAGRLIR
jgi:hypothetical protein